MPESLREGKVAAKLGLHPISNWKVNFMKVLQTTIAAALAFALTMTLPAARGADNKAEAYKYGKEGVEAAKKKDWDKAIDAFRKATKADPTDPNNFNNLGLAYKSAGKLPEALKAFTDGLEAQDNASGYFNRGVVYVSMQQYEKAIQDFDSSLKLESNNVAAHRFRAFAYLQNKEYAKAVSDYGVVLEDKPNDPEILEREAFAYWNLKQYDKAIANYDKIIKLKPNDPQGYLQRSYVYELKGDLAKGIADCDKVLSLDPNNTDAKNRKARLEYQLKKTSPTPTPTARPRRTLPPELTPTPRKMRHPGGGE